MLTRGKVLLLTILCLLSLVSIGFASWTITESDEEIVYGSMHTDNVINSAEFIQLDTTLGDIANPGISCFKYQETGYLSEDGSYVTDTGYIYTYYVLDLEKCYNLFSSEFNSIVLTINLGYANNVTTDLNLFKYKGNTSGYQDIDAECSSQTTGINPTLNEIESSIDKQYSIQLTFTDILANYTTGSPKEVRFTVKYSLFATTGTYFNTEIFRYLYMDMVNVISFKADLYVSGAN